MSSLPSPDPSPLPSSRELVRVLLDHYGNLLKICNTELQRDKVLDMAERDMNRELVKILAGFYQV